MALVILIAILVALIWVHELGHFSVAKLFGVKVSEFAIGFPPRLLLECAPYLNNMARQVTRRRTAWIKTAFLRLFRSSTLMATPPTPSPR